MKSASKSSAWRVILRLWRLAAAGLAGIWPRRLFYLGLALGLGALALRAYMLTASVEFVPVTADESITVLQAKRICEGELPLLVLAQPYQFPVEAYLSAPLVHWVARDTWGARYVSFLEGFLGLLLLILLVRKAGAARQTWPALLLIVFPSAYLLMIQFGYSLPHNSPIYLAAWGAMLLTIGGASRFSWSYCLKFILAGLLCGLAFTNNMVALALIVPILLGAVFQGGWRKIGSNLLLLAAGVAIGLIPFFAAIWSQPGAHAAVAGTRSFGETLSYLWEPTVNVTLTRALGVTPALFPDSGYVLNVMPWLFPIMPFVFIGILLAATVLRAVAFVRRLIRGQFPTLGVWDVFVGVAWLNLVVFAASVRSVSCAYRYLAPAAWSFPFLVGAVYCFSGKRVRVALGTLCVGLAAFNIITTVKLTEAWSAPDFAEQKVDAPDLYPAIEYLHQQGIDLCVASHWQAYRLNFYTDETILCSQPLNERFRDWPIPYKQQVDAGTNVAYVLSEFSSQDVNPSRFEADLAQMRIMAHKAVLGQFSIYSGFSPASELMQEACLPPDRLEVRTSHNPDAARRLLEDCATPWATRRLQEQGMWIEVDLKEPRWLSRIVLFYDDYYADRAPLMDICLRIEGKWRVAGKNISGDLDPFEFVNGHPVYQRYVQTIRGVDYYLADGVRLEIVEANPTRLWSLAKIELYAVDQDVSRPGPSAGAD